MPVAVTVNPAGAAAIVLFKIHVVSTDIGIIIWGGALVIPAGAAAIVPRMEMLSIVTVMEHGAVLCVPVIPAGRGMIAL